MNVEIPNTHRFSKRKPDNNWQSRVQRDSSYYQPQLATYKQTQNYHHDRRTQQNTFINYYDRNKVVKHGNIQPLFHWEMILIQEIKTQLIFLRLA